MNKVSFCLKIAKIFSYERKIGRTTKKILNNLVKLVINLFSNIASLCFFKKGIYYF